MLSTESSKTHIKKVQPKKGLLKEPGVCKPS